MTANLYDLIQRSAPADPAAPMLETPDGRRYAWGDLDRLTGRIANLLAAEGVAPGDRVAVQVAKSPEVVFLYLACLRAGAVYLPLNTGYTLAELDYFFGDAEPAVIVCDPERAAGIGGLESAAGARVLTLDAEGRGALSDAAARAPAAFATVARSADDLAAILYTSGTTGRAKGAMLSHGNLASNALTLRDAWGFTAADVLLHMLPIYHTHGLFVAINPTLLAGARMIFLPRFEPGAVIAALPRATVTMGVPTFYVRLLARADFTAAVSAQHAPLHLRLGAAAGGDLPRLRGAHRPAHPRALRHDRDRHEHLQPAPRRAASGHGRARRCRGSRPGSRTRPAACCRPARPASSRSAGRTFFPDTGACPRRPGRNSAPTASSSPATSPGSMRAATSRSSAGPRT